MGTSVVKKSLIGLFAAFVGFILLALFPGVGGFAQTRLGESWIFPSGSIFATSAHRRMTETAIERIFRDQMKGWSDPKVTHRDLARHLIRLCKKHDLDPAFVLSVIAAESAFRTQVVSSAGAIGLLQIMPDTGRYVARKHGIPYSGKQSLKNPKVSLTLGTAYLAELRDRYRGLSPYFQLAAYNMGPARLDQLRAMPNFKPKKTLEYYEKIMRGVERFRYYSSRMAQMEAEKAFHRGNRRKLTRSVEKSDRSNVSRPI